MTYGETGLLICTNKMCQKPVTDLYRYLKCHLSADILRTKYASSVRISFLPSFSISCKLGVNGLKKLLSQIYWNIENILNTLKYIEVRHLSIKTSPLQFLLQINPLETFVLGRFLSSYILFNWVKIRTSWGASHPSALMNNCLNKSHMS